jgi:hypothetical protein
VWCAVLQPEGEDNLKRTQLEALAVLNGTFRGGDGKAVTLASPRKCTVGVGGARSPSTLYSTVIYRVM